MRIKKFCNNEYLMAEGVWVRNPRSSGDAVDVNEFGKNELPLFLENETGNMRLSGMRIDDMDRSRLENVVICSDGYGWRERQKVLASLPNQKVKVMGVNGSLARWEMVGEKAESKRTMTFYLANNPYPECRSYLPVKHRYYPTLVSSTRTDPVFLKEYGSEPYFYRPTPDPNYSGIMEKGGHVRLDDYRNPVCAAISLAWRMGVKKMALLCCDESFEDERPGAVKMNNGLYQYPQQIKCQRVIDAQLYWLKQAGVEIADCSSGVEYENAAYINFKDMDSFFTRDDN